LASNAHCFSRTKISEPDTDISDTLQSARMCDRDCSAEIVSESPVSCDAQEYAPNVHSYRRGMEDRYHTAVDGDVYQRISDSWFDCPFALPTRQCQRL